MTDAPRLDGMCIFILKDKEHTSSVDYFFACEVHEKDPRFRGRYMNTGQRRGLFRIAKATLDAELLWPMDLDREGKCFQRAAGKVMKEFQETGAFPEKTAFQSG